MLGINNHVDNNFLGAHSDEGDYGVSFNWEGAIRWRYVETGAVGAKANIKLYFYTSFISRDEPIFSRSVIGARDAHYLCTSSDLTLDL